MNSIFCVIQKEFCNMPVYYTESAMCICDVCGMCVPIKFRSFKNNISKDEINELSYSNIVATNVTNDIIMTAKRKLNGNRQSTLAVCSTNKCFHLFAFHEIEEIVG